MPKTNTITHHCDTCGAQVDEFCSDHPRSMVVSVVSRKIHPTTRERFIRDLSRQIAREARAERERYGAHVAEYLIRRGADLIESMRRRDGAA